ncbi:UDP-D-xylose:L-fucose alpha-1,3-D-xylosyltransferase 1-like [Argonauta hians]
MDRLMWNGAVSPDSLYNKLSALNIQDTRIISKMPRFKRYFVFLCFFMFISVFVFVGMKFRPKNYIKNETKVPLIKMKTKSPENIGDVIQETVTIAKEIMKKHNVVLFTFINNAYLPFVYSWLCNTVHMNVHKQTLFITTDFISKEKFKRDWPDVKVVVMHEASLNGNQSYSKVGYIKLMVKRSEVLNSLLQNNIEILLFEVDCLWVSNPIDECRKRALKNDIVVTCIAGIKTSIAGGFLYMKPTKPTKTLWAELNKKMRHLGHEIDKKDDKSSVSEAKNDQMFLMRLIQNRFGGIKYEVLPYDSFTDGKWYLMKFEERKKKKVIILNNNWVIGNTVKINRAKKFGHWFIDNSMKCNMTQVDIVVKQGLYV